MKYLLPLILCACAPMTEQQRFDREYKYAVEVEKYVERREACKRDGRIWFTKFLDRPKAKPTVYDMRTARCITSLEEAL